MDLAQEVGYLKGMQEATQRELHKINSAVGELQTTTATKQDVENLRTELSDKIDEAVTKLQGGSGTHVKKVDEPVWKTLLFSPVASTMITVAAIILVIILFFSRDTGRDVRTYTPWGSAPTPPPADK